MGKHNDKKMIADIRSLAIDMIKESGSGHPGIALGAAPILYSVYTYHLRYDLNKMDWCNRDRFVLSCGHASSLLYAMLHCIDEGKYNLNDLSDIVMIDESIEVSDFITLSDDTIMLSDADVLDTYSTEIDGSDISFLI